LSSIHFRRQESTANSASRIGAYDDCARAGVNVFPENAADLVLPHRSTYRELNDSSDWQKLSWIRFEVLDQAIELVLCWPAVAGGKWAFIAISMVVSYVLRHSDCSINNS
jgi:hypothetical protein